MEFFRTQTGTLVLCAIVLTVVFAIGDCWLQKLWAFIKGERDYFGPWKRK